MNKVVRTQLKKENAWYIDDQRLNQLGEYGARWTLMFRWMLFARLVNMWMSDKRLKGSLSVLDAGCGDGINSGVLLNIFKDYQISLDLIGCDYNEYRLSRAKKSEYLQVVGADLRTLPFKNENFDLILCSHVLEHIYEDVEAMMEIARVLKPGGAIVVAVPNEGCILGRLRNHVLQRRILGSTDHVHFYTANVFLSSARKAGLELSGSVCHGGFFIPHTTLYQIMRNSIAGRKIIDILSFVLPSQAADIVMLLKKL